MKQQFGDEQSDNGQKNFCHSWCFHLQKKPIILANSIRKIRHKLLLETKRLKQSLFTNNNNIKSFISSESIFNFFFSSNVVKIPEAFTTC